MKIFLRILLSIAAVIGGLYVGIWLAQIGTLEPHNSSKMNFLFYAWMFLGVGLLVFLAYLKIRDMHTVARTGKRRSKRSWSIRVQGYLTLMMLCMAILSLSLDVALLVAVTGFLFVVFLSSFAKTIRSSTVYERNFLKK